MVDLVVGFVVIDDYYVGMLKHWNAETWKKPNVDKQKKSRRKLQEAWRQPEIKTTKKEEAKRGERKKDCLTSSN